MKKMLKLLFPLFLSATIIGSLAGCKEKLPTGSFYTLQEAYEKGWLTKEDLMNIAYYHNAQYFKVAIGKGIVTEEKLSQLVNRYAEQLGIGEEL